MSPSSIPAHPALAVYGEAAKRAIKDAADNPGATAPSFGNLLAQSLDDAITSGKTSEAASIQATSGRTDLQNVVEAVNAAEINLQTVVSIRDRVISAYQEILRMPI